MVMSARSIALTVLQFLAIASCMWGIYIVYGVSPTPWSVGYNSLWFVFGIASNVAGLLSVLFFQIDEDVERRRPQLYLQFHYLIGWLCVVVGYPSIVGHTWMVHSNSYYSYLYSLLSFLPMISWFGPRQYVVILTQFSTLVAFFAHLAISYLTANSYGYAGAIIMIFIIIALSVPTRARFYGLSGREAFIFSMGLASYVFAVALNYTIQNPKQVRAADLLRLFRK